MGGAEDDLDALVLPDGSVQNRCPGKPSASMIAGSNAPVSADTMPPVVALVYSCALTPQSLYIRYSGIIRKSETPSSRPASLSAYS